MAAAAGARGGWYADRGFTKSYKVGPDDHPAGSLSSETNCNATGVEWHFRSGREYPHLCCVLTLLRRQHEACFRKVELSCDRLHLPLGQCGSVDHNRERVAAELPISEHINRNDLHLHSISNSLLTK
jgi:hypothetical protein